MPQIIYANVQKKVDGAVKGKILDFLTKLQQSDETSGLHIEPMKTYQDPRVRTGRVSLEYRAVLFKLDGEKDTFYVYVGTWHHDEAIKQAQTMKLTLDPLAGMPSIEQVEPEAQLPEPTATTAPAGTPTPEQQLPLLATWGVSLEDLVERLGLSESFAAAALACADEDAVMELCARAPIGWQGEALLELASGVSIEDIREKLSLDQPVEVEDDTTEDERTVRALTHPAVQESFTLVGDQKALQEILDSADFAAWRVFLHPEQRRYVAGSWNGPFRLTGGAGTGKTVVLVHRARELARRNPEDRIVLTTYTRNLAVMLREQLQLLDPDVPLAEHLGDPGIYVANVDALARPLIDACGGDITETTQEVLGRATSALRNRPRGNMWTAAIAQAGDALPVELKAPSFFSSEYSMVVLPHRISKRGEYFQVARPGRGVALSRKARSEVWNVIEAYRSTADLEALIDYDEYIELAAAHAQRTETTVADHVLVDEGQDLTPPRWQMLRAMVAPGKDDLFVAEDAHQRIYGGKVVLGRYDIKIVGRSRRLTLNYRTTAQNLRWAVDVLKGGDYTDADDDAVTTAGYHSARLGPAVSMLECGSLSEQLDEVAERVDAWEKDPDVDPSTIAILTRDASTRTKVVTGLSERHVTVKPVEGHESSSRLPVAMTMHRAKGCEFSRVVLFDVSEGSVPAALNGEKYSEEAWADAMLRERSLLYVAATRARDELVVVWQGERSGLLRTDVGPGAPQSRHED